MIKIVDAYADLPDSVRRYRARHPDRVRTLASRYRRAGRFCWYAMLHRCLCRDDKTHWDRYGGRGITVCRRWQGPNGFKNFIADIGPRPSLKHSIDRINPNGNYTASNVRWATIKQQRNNRRAP